jgi:hypothetical protein
MIDAIGTGQRSFRSRQARRLRLRPPTAEGACDLNTHFLALRIATTNADDHDDKQRYSPDGIIGGCGDRRDSCRLTDHKQIRNKLGQHGLLGIRG